MVTAGGKIPSFIWSCTFYRCAVCIIQSSVQTLLTVAAPIQQVGPQLCWFVVVKCSLFLTVCLCLRSDQLESDPGWPVCSEQGNWTDLAPASYWETAVDKWYKTDQSEWHRRSCDLTPYYCVPVYQPCITLDHIWTRLLSPPPPRWDTNLTTPPSPRHCQGNPHTVASDWQFTFSWSSNECYGLHCRGCVKITFNRLALYSKSYINFDMRS